MSFNTGITGSGFHENRGLTIVPFSSTPSFDGSLSTGFLMILTGNVTSSTFLNGQDGQLYSFLIRQDSSGLHSFAWPSNFKGMVSIPITALANTTAVQTVLFDASTGNCYPGGTGLLNL